MVKNVCKKLNDKVVETVVPVLESLKNRKAEGDAQAEGINWAKFGITCVVVGIIVVCVVALVAKGKSLHDGASGKIDTGTSTIKTLLGI